MLHYHGDTAQLDLDLDLKALKREASLLTAHIRPRAIEIRDTQNYKPASERVRISDADVEHRVLLEAQCVDEEDYRKSGEIGILESSKDIRAV